MQETKGSKKILFAFLSIGLSAVALVLGFLFRKPLMNSMTPGFWLSFVSFLLSFTSVEEHGSNFAAKIAFWLGFLSMCITVWLGAMA